MEFEAVIGLEIHVQMSTKTKMFCRCDNDSWEKEPNVNVCPVCMGFPGQLPVLNVDAVSKGLIAALALNCAIPSHCKFDRKNYFYPDSPKGFQISQYDEPISKDGNVDIIVEGKPKNVRITRLHLEDDAGKMTHVRDGSLVDFNRAGTPLMEIVSEPDLRNAQEASAYAREIQKIVRYVGSSEADMEKGMMRFDASVSIRPVGESKLYPRAEIKNLNSFKMLESAIAYEIERQTGEWQEKGPLKSPITVGWDDEKGETFFMRDKEESDDYRYFPEPDLPPLVLDKKTVEKYRAGLPELPAVRKKRYVDKLGLKEDDARILSDDLKLAQYFEEVVAKCGDPKAAVSFINTILMKFLKEELIEVDQQKVTAEMMAELIKLVNDDVVAIQTARTVLFDKMYKTGQNPRDLVNKGGFRQITDLLLIDKVCKKIVNANPDPVKDVRDGKGKALGFLIGLVMQEMNGQADPKMVNNTLRKYILLK